MARLFDDASTESLGLTPWSAVTATPFSASAWVYPDDDSNNEAVVFSIADKDTVYYHALMLDNDNLTKGGLARTYTVGGVSDATTGNDWVANTWNHIGGTWVTAASRAVWLNGGTKATNTVSATVSNIDQVTIGASADSTPFGPFSGRIAEVGLWNVMLTEAEIISLSKGFSPLLIRPKNLIAYWPLGGLHGQSDKDHWKNGYDMTAYNTPTWADHPPIFYPGRAQIGVSAAAAAGAIMNQMQNANLGADLFDGALSV